MRGPVEREEIPDIRWQSRWVEAHPVSLCGAENRGTACRLARASGGESVLQLVCENAMVLAIVAASTTITVTLGYGLLGIASRYAY